MQVRRIRALQGLHCVHMHARVYTVSHTGADKYSHKVTMLRVYLHDRSVHVCNSLWLILNATQTTIMQNCRAKCPMHKNYIASQAGAAGVTGLAVPSTAAVLPLCTATAICCSKYSCVPMVPQTEFLGSWPMQVLKVVVTIILGQTPLIDYI